MNFPARPALKSTLVSGVGAGPGVGTVGLTGWARLPGRDLLDRRDVLDWQLPAESQRLSTDSAMTRISARCARALLEETSER